MINKTLIVYATKAGSTQEVAEFMGHILRENGIQADVLEVSEVENIDAYQAVILGSAIRLGNVLSPMVQFAQRHQHALNQRATAFFTLCMTMKIDTPENRHIAERYLSPLWDVVEPISVGLFSGTIKPANLSRITRWIVKRDRTQKLSEGDFRDWAAIRAWTEALIPQLHHAILTL